MVLFQVYAPSIAVDPFEGDAPGAIDVDGVTSWPSAQSVKIEAGDIQLLQPFRQVQHAKAAADSIHQVRPQSAGVVLDEQPRQATVAEAPDHARSVTRVETVSNIMLQVLPVGIWPPRLLAREGLPAPALGGRAVRRRAHVRHQRLRPHLAARQASRQRNHA